ncbi:MAG: phage tail tube protein [Candidatus Omnitrophica bacterium]|nr:phage tail tube protein [Candidatus Omnitrophota bacterium]
MPQLNTKLGLLTFDKEQNWGQLVPPQTIHPIFGETITSRNDLEVRDIIVKTIDYKLAWTGNFTVSGGISLPFYYNLAGYFLYALFGKVETTELDTGIYKHVFTFSDVLPSFSTYVDRITAVFAYPGCMVNRGSFRFSADEMPITFDVDLIAKTELKYTGQMPTVVIPNQKVFIRTGTAIKVNNSANNNVKSIDVNIDNRIDTRQSRTLTSGRFITDPARGAPEVSGSVTSIFASMYEWEIFWGSPNQPAEIELTGVPIELTVTGDTIGNTNYKNQFKLIIPKAYLMARSNGTLSRAGEWIDVTFDFQAIYDVSYGYLASAELINTHPSYT